MKKKDNLNSIKLSKLSFSKQCKYISNSSKFLQAEIIIGLSSYLNINSGEKSNDSNIDFFSLYLIKLKVSLNLANDEFLKFSKDIIYLSSINC